MGASLETTVIPPCLSDSGGRRVSRPTTESGGILQRDPIG